MSFPLIPRSAVAGLPAGLAGDVRQAFRLLWKSRGLAATTLLTLALCIGATTTIFSIVNALMLKPLPFPEPEGIVEVSRSAPKVGASKLPVDPHQSMDLSRDAKSFASAAIWVRFDGVWGEEGSVKQLPGVRTTAGMFDVLHISPVLGRFFTEGENRPGADNVVVVTSSWWESEFGRDPAVIGRTLRLDGTQVTIVGVAPRELEAMDARVKFLRPLGWSPGGNQPPMRWGQGPRLFGRLQRDVPLAAAQEELKALDLRSVEAAGPQARDFVERTGMHTVVSSVQGDRIKPVKSILFLLQGGVAFVLFIGCLNVANLQLVRANARQSELAIRFALGASRPVLVRQLLVENIVLTGFGAVFGLVLAAGALTVVNGYTKNLLPQALPFALDGGVLAFALGLTVVVGLGVGLIPAAYLARANLSEVMQRSSRGTSANRGVRRLSSGLVVGQVAVALILLTGAGLLVESFANVLRVDRGVDVEGVVGVGVSLPESYRGSDQAAQGLQDRMLQALDEIPGAKAATLAYSMPLVGGLGVNGVTLADDPTPAGSPPPAVHVVTVTPGYLATMGLRLVEGRFFEPGDVRAPRRPYVVDESFARKYFPNRSAVGGHLNLGPRPGRDSDWPTIVGVVKDVPHNGVEYRNGNPFMYQLMGGRPGGFGLFQRTDRPLAEAVKLIHEKIRRLEPAIGVFEGATVESAMVATFNTRRAVMLLLASFAGLALFLAALGIYGVLAYDVTQRTREIGVRGAVGASPGQIVGLIITQGLWKTTVGLVIGLVGAVFLSRYMTSLLFEVRPTEPAVYATVSFVLVAVALLASWLPARRAAKIDPLVALRDE